MTPRKKIVRQEPKEHEWETRTEWIRLSNGMKKKISVIRRRESMTDRDDEPAMNTEPSKPETT